MKVFVGDDAENTISYADAGVTVDLQTPANNKGSFAEGDTYENIENIQGSSHADTLIGDSQDNTLDGGENADTLDGGAGDDKALYGDSGVGVRVDLSRTGAQANFETNTFGFTTSQGGDAVGDTLVNIENVEGSAHNDWLTGDDENNDLRGGGGNDRLEGGEGEDTLQGGAGNDVLAGGEHSDTYLSTRATARTRSPTTEARSSLNKGRTTTMRGATYTFTYSDRSSDVRLIVVKDSNTLNVIDFSTHPSGYHFTTRGTDGSDTRIPDTSLALPGSEGNPFLATDSVDSFTGFGDNDWVSYAGSNEGVTIYLGAGTASG